MSTDYRALCAELMNEAIYLGSLPYEQDPDPDLITRARAALAQPEPVGPTDEEIMDLMPQQMREDLAAAGRALAEQAGTDSRSATGVMRIMLNRHAVDHARAVLARWGRPTPQPIPVSERLPGVEDCDGEGRCWVLGKVGQDWRLISTINPGVPKLSYCFSHWLPFHALPLPEGGAA